MGFRLFKTQDKNKEEYYMVTKYEKCSFSVHFPAYIDGFPVRVIGSEIFENNNTDKSPAKWVEEIYIPKTVTLIKSRAFADCPNLAKVNFAGTHPKMYDDSFCNCPKLKNHPENFLYNIPDFTKLNQLDLTKRQDRDGNLCYEILRYKGYDTAVRFPEYIDNLPVRIIGTEIFERKNPSTDKWETHWVEEIYIPKTVILIKDRAFMDCNELEKIYFEGDIPEIQPDAFLRCNKLMNPPPLQERITEPWRKSGSYNTQRPTRFESERILGRNAVCITKIFSYRDEVTVPETIDGLPVVEVKGGVQRDRDERRRNDGNYTLKKIYFPDSVEKIGKMSFMKCWGLENVRLPNNPKLVLCADSFWGCEKLCLENVTFPDGKDYSDYMDAFGNCNEMQSSYHRKKQLEHEQVIQSRQFFSTDKKIAVSGENNIYKALCKSQNVAADEYENIVIDDSWKRHFRSAHNSNIIFENKGNKAVIPIITHYKRVWGGDSFSNQRDDLYIRCIENKSADGKFFDTELYDENILNLIDSMKRKLDICYYRLSSGYRLSQKHAEMYEKFVREHAKKSVYRAIDAHDSKRLEWCRKLGLVGWHYNAVLEYAKRKGAADMFGEIPENEVWGILKYTVYVSRGRELTSSLNISKVYRRIKSDDGNDMIVYKGYKEELPAKGFVPVAKPKLDFGQSVYLKNDRKFAHISEILWDSSKNKMFFKVDASKKSYYYENLKPVCDIVPKKKENEYIFEFYGFRDWLEFIFVAEVIRSFSPEKIDIDCLNKMKGCFVLNGITVYMNDRTCTELAVTEKTMRTHGKEATETINAIWHRCVELMLERQAK